MSQPAHSHTPYRYQLRDYVNTVLFILLSLIHDSCVPQLFDSNSRLSRYKCRCSCFTTWTLPLNNGFQHLLFYFTNIAIVLLLFGR